MFVLANSDDLGKYLEKLITSKYKNVRQFCVAYLEHEKILVNDEEIRKKQNKIGQIIKGNKGIQLYDLPIFCDLLDVSCEELLSAGKRFVKKSDRVTNYSVALSKNKKDWETYINREEKLLLNKDEYGKTALDYAIKYKNYGFLKFLIENEYLRFGGKNPEDFVATIYDKLQYVLSDEAKLRKEIIILAIENNDVSILDKLRARETRSIYDLLHDCVNIKKNYSDELMNALVTASDEILNYFSDNILIDDFFKCSQNFVFPFATEMISKLIENDNNFAEVVIRKFIKHNEETYTKLKSIIAEEIENNLKPFKTLDEAYYVVVRPDRISAVLQFFDFYKDDNVVSFYCHTVSKRLVTNIVRSNTKSANPKINYLIQDLNNSFDKIVNIKNEFIEEGKQ